MKKPIFFLLFLFSLNVFANDSWPANRQSLNGDIKKISYIKDGKSYVKVAFLDADSNLRIAPSGKPSANSATDVQVLPCIGSRVKFLKEQGYLIAIVSNQGGISSGKVEFKTADSALQETMRQTIIRNKAAFYHWYDFAEDYDSYFGIDSKLNTFRKPGQGMALLLEEALKKFNIFIDKEKSFMVGDSLFKKKLGELKPNGSSGIQFSHSDRCFAQNYGIRYFDPADFFGWNSKKLFNTPFFDNVKGAYDINFYFSYPKKALAGGKEESQFCQGLPTYSKYTNYIKSKTPLDQWRADYQCIPGKCVDAYSGKEFCPN